MSETMAERIKRLRIEHNMTQEELGEKVGIKRAAINKYEKGNVENMKRSMIEKMSSIFGVSPVYLMALDNYNGSSIEKIYSQLSPPRQQKVYDFAESQLKDQKQETKQKNNPITSLEQIKKKKEKETIYGKVKWCGAVSAGTGEFLVDETYEEIELPIEQIPLEADFCLSVNGDSMEPIFHDDEYVFVKKQLDIFSGKIGVAVLNGEAFLKRIWLENDGARLESLNKKYKDIIVTKNDDFRIIGKVVM